MRERNGELFLCEPYDGGALLSGKEPRGPYLLFDGGTLRTDIFGQIPLFVSDERIGSQIFEGGIQHDPTREILLSHHDFLFRDRKRLPRIKLKEPVKELADAFREAVKIRARERIGILLSGGVDSSAIASVLSREGHDFRAFCVADGKDLEHAEALSKKLGFELIPVHLDIDEVEERIPEIFRIIGMKEYLKSTPVYLPVITSLSITFYFAFREAEKHGIEGMFSGIGSEELFAGFTDWTGEPIERQIEERSYTLYKRDLWRDHALARHFGMGMKYPFLDRVFAEIALSIPAEIKLEERHKKYIWRKAAEHLGVPPENAWRKNKATQYGSGSDSILERLTKRSGKRYRAKYLEGILKSME